MFWDCFSYDYKELCHVWKSEIAKKKKTAVKELAAINALNETAAKKEWELNTVI